MDFQYKVKFVLMHLQFSQEELAHQMGSSFATISGWERENRKPKQNGLYFMSKVSETTNHKGLLMRNFLSGTVMIKPWKVAFVPFFVL